MAILCDIWLIFRVWTPLWNQRSLCQEDKDGCMLDVNDSGYNQKALIKGDACHQSGQNKTYVESLPKSYVRPLQDIRYENNYGFGY